MNARLAEYLRGKLGIIQPILAELSAASGLFTYLGLSIDADTFEAKAHASVLALAGSALIYLFWSEVLKIVPYVNSTKDKLTLFAIIAGFFFIIFNLSSANNAGGLAGKDAQNHHAAHYAGVAAIVVGEAFKRSMLIEGLAADLRGEVAHYETAIENEIKSGAYSGSPGPGAVHTALTEIRNRLAISYDETEAFIRLRDQLGESARGRLEMIRKIATSDQPLEKRNRDLARESDALRAELARMDPLVLADSLARTLEALPQVADMQAKFSSDPKTAKRQREALEKLRSDIAATAARLGKFIDEAREEDAPQLQAFERVSAVRAVMIYWPNYIAFWAGGIALDIGPLAIVLLIMVAKGAKSKEELAMTSILGLRVADISSAHVAGQVIRAAGADPKTILGFNKLLLGHLAPENQKQDDEENDQ